MFKKNSVGERHGGFSSLRFFSFFFAIRTVSLAKMFLLLLLLLLLQQQDTQKKTRSSSSSRSTRNTLAGHRRRPIRTRNLHSKPTKPQNKKEKNFEIKKKRKEQKRETP